jgi:hypothetical protein
VLICLSEEVRSTTNDIAELDKELEEQGGRITFGMRLDQPDEVTGQAKECRATKWVRPGWTAHAS